MKTDTQMRHDIYINVLANGLDVTGDLQLMLYFRTSAQLRKICRDMQISLKA